MLQKPPDTLAHQDAEIMQHSGRETTSAAREVSRTSSVGVPQTSPVFQTPSRSLAKPSPLTSASSLVTRTAADGPRTSGTLATLLQGSQAAEAKEYFTGLLPGKTPPPRSWSASGPKPPTVSTNKVGTVPSFTGFTGKLGSAANGTPKFEFSAVSILFQIVVITSVSKSIQ